jgi:hypothetical protein
MLIVNPNKQKRASMTGLESSEKCQDLEMRQYISFHQASKEYIPRGRSLKHDHLIIHLSLTPDLLLYLLSYIQPQ